jgi:hypothetical protein|tara:strand:- start:60 stop:746 length:687 start_codon:yes stop_codon:yes gene_type:complete
MKKIISALFATMCLVAFQAPAQSADVSFSVGLAGNQGGYHARGTETIQQTGTDKIAEIEQEAGVFEDTHPSIFLEVNIGDNMTVGAEFAMDDIETPTNTNAVVDRQGDEDDDFVTNTAKATFSDKNTVYVQARLLGGLYTKIMYHNVNVISEENLGTGGSYGDATVEGLGLGIGYQYDIDDLGVFVRAEVTASAYEDVKAVNADDVTKVIMIDNMYGAEGSIRVGKTF